jgi:hypothetical protein
MLNAILETGLTLQIGLMTVNPVVLQVILVILAAAEAVCASRRMKINEDKRNLIVTSPGGYERLETRPMKQGFLTKI